MSLFCLLEIKFLKRLTVILPARLQKLNREIPDIQPSCSIT